MNSMAKSVMEWGGVGVLEMQEMHTGCIEGDVWSRFLAQFHEHVLFYH